jgi:hypothetical protein
MILNDDRYAEKGDGAALQTLAGAGAIEKERFAVDIPRNRRER